MPMAHQSSKELTLRNSEELIPEISDSECCKVSCYPGIVLSRFFLGPGRPFYTSKNSGSCLTSNAASIARWALVTPSIWHQSSLVFLARLLHPPSDGLFVFLKSPRAMFSVRAPNRNQKKRVIANAPSPKGRSGQTEKALSTWRSPLQGYFGQLADSAKRPSLKGKLVMPSGAIVSSHTNEIRNSYPCQNKQALCSLWMPTCTASQAPNHITASSFASSEQIQKPSSTFPKSYGIMLPWNFETRTAWVKFYRRLPL